MGVRQWMKQRLAADSGEDMPPGSSLLNVLLGKEAQPVHSLGEYTAQTSGERAGEICAPCWIWRTDWDDWGALCSPAR